MTIYHVFMIKNMRTLTFIHLFRTLISPSIGIRMPPDDFCDTVLS